MIKFVYRIAACEDVLRTAGFELAGYRVDEWLYTEYGETPHGRPRATLRPHSVGCWRWPGCGGCRTHRNAQSSMEKP